MLVDALDIRTLSLVSVLFALLFGVGLAAFSGQQRRFKGLSAIAIGDFCLAGGFALIALRGHVPDMLSIVAANALILAGFALYLEGVLRFREQPSFLRWTGPLLLVVLLPLLRYYTLVEPDVSARIVWLSSFLAALSALCALRLLKAKQDDPFLPRLMTAAPFALFAAFSVVRALWTNGAAPLPSFLEAGHVHALAFLLADCLLMLSSFGFLWMTSARLELELRQEARTDQLTRLYNRRALQEAAVREMARAKRHGLNFSVILVDVDRFKHINDKLGHQAGDLVLKAVAAALKDNLRVQDMAARFGGEEFMLLLPDTDAAGAKQVAEKLRQAVQDLSVHVKGTVVELTASFGVAALGRGWDFEDLLRRADQAMYQAKTLGRNRVCVG